MAPVIPRNRPEADISDVFHAIFGAKHDVLGRFSELVRSVTEQNSAPIFTATGRAALFHLLRALPHQIVYIPAYTCWVVHEAAKLSGKEIRLLDIDYPSFKLSRDALRTIAQNPGVLIATHQFGFPEDIEEVREILGDSDHFIVEDCAGAMCCRLRKKTLGTIGDAAIFSFEVGKLLGCGGGALFVRDPAMRNRIASSLRDSQKVSEGIGPLVRIGLRCLISYPSLYGTLLPLYLAVRGPTDGLHRNAISPGDTYHRSLTSYQAALGLALEQRLSEIVNRRRQIFDYYRSQLCALEHVGVPPLLADSEVCAIRFPILLKDHDKRRVYEKTLSLGVDLGFSFSYSLSSDSRAYPGATRMATETINLPLYSHLEISDCDHVLESFSKATATSQE